MLYSCQLFTLAPLLAAAAAGPPPGPLELLITYLPMVLIVLTATTWLSIINRREADDASNPAE